MFITDTQPMEPTTTPEDFDFGEDPVARRSARELPTQPMLAARQRCAACGAPLAPDQRYCIQCGERRGPARMPSSAHSEPSPATLAPARPGKPKMSVNASLIAGVGTLMLAMGTGVLIGRTASSSARSNAPLQVVTVPSATAAGASTSGSVGPSGGEEGHAGTTTPANSEKPAAQTGRHSRSKATARTQSVPAKSVGSLPQSKKPVVKVGTPGNGPGYEKGRFTGNFFGNEEEEEKK